MLSAEVQTIDESHIGDKRSVSDAQLAELATVAPGQVLDEVGLRVGRAISEPAAFPPKIQTFMQVLERIQWSDLEAGEFRHFSQILVQVATMAPSALPLVFKIVLGDAAQKRSSRCEAVICQIFRFIPASMPVLLSSLEFNFPHHSRPEDHLFNYSEMLLALLKDIPLIRPKILDLMLEKYLTIDVAIQLEATNLPEELEVETVSEIAEEEQAEEYEVMDSDLLRRSSSPIALNMVEMMSKLDRSLSLLFSFFRDLKGEELKSAFSHLLQSFEHRVLPTFRSRSVPFLVFYTSSLDSGLPDVFLGFLMKRLYHLFEDPSNTKKKSSASTASLLTVVTASYIGSYVSRAKFLTNNLVRLSFDMLLTWAMRFLGDLPTHMRSNVKALRSGTNMVSERVAVFYAVTQAIMYIFCFRHKMLIQETSNRLETIANLRNFLLPILQSSLNPLKWCMSAVVEEFMRLAEMYDLVDCRQILERSSRRSAPPVSSSSNDVKTFDGAQMTSLINNQTGSYLGDLDSYFPFDPLILKSCGCFISSDLYNEWTSRLDESESESEDEDEEMSDVSEEDEEEEVEESHAINRELLLCNPAWQGLAIRKLAV